MKSFTGFVRTIAGIGFAILVMIILSSFAPDLFWGLVGIIGMIIGYSAPLVFILLFIRSWKLSKKIGMRGSKIRAKFMVLRAFQDVFRGSYNRMVRGEPELTQAQRLRLLHHDNGLTDQQLKDSLAALRPAKRRTSDDTTERTAPAPQAPKPETVTPDRTAPRSVRMTQQTRTQQPPAIPVEEQRHEAPVEDETIEFDEVKFEEPVPAPAPQQRPAPRQTPRPRGSSVNSSTPSSGFGGSIRITGDWGQPKN
jgi:hypothetical protein